MEQAHAKALGRVTRIDEGEVRRYLNKLHTQVIEGASAYAHLHRLAFTTRQEKPDTAEIGIGSIDQLRGMAGC